MTVTVCGARLNLDQICSIAEGNSVEVCESSLKQLSGSRAAYEAEASRGRVYGYSTGLGALAEVEEGEAGSEREHRILVEHDTGIGPDAPRELVRAAMAVRLLQMSRGAAPVRPEVALRLADALNHDVIPAVPLYGSVGASGDLAPLARISRCLYSGEGYAITKEGRRILCSEALGAAGLRPIELRPGEALALINSDAWSVAMASIGVCVALRLVRKSLEVAARSLSVTGCNPQHFSEAVAAVKPHPGVAEAIRALGSPCRRSPRLQDPYSIRCLPMIYGAALDHLEFAKEVLEAEASSSSDNPFVYNGSVYHACNFHGAYASMAADVAKIAIAHVANSIERRTAHLLSSATTGLPEFLRPPNGVVGAMIYQYTAAALASAIRELAHSLGVSSIPTSGLQEDVVSMAPVAGLELLRADALLARLIAVEDALAAQAERVSRGEQLEDPREAIESAEEGLLNSLGLPMISKDLQGLL